jgi:protein SCO1/2
MNPAAFAPLVLLAAGLVLVSAARAADDPAHHHHHQDQPAAQDKPSSVQVKYGDAVLVNQDGKKIKLKSEVFGNRLVVMDFAYTTCTTVCPVLTAVLVKVQAELGDKAGRDVQLYHTVDPARDTRPASRRCRQTGAKAGWTWSPARWPW